MASGEVKLAEPLELDRWPLVTRRWSTREYRAVWICVYCIIWMVHLWGWLDVCLVALACLFVDSLQNPLGHSHADDTSFVLLELD